MNYILDARTATPRFPGIGRYVDSLSEALYAELAPTESLTILTDTETTNEYPRKITTVSTPVSPFQLSQQWQIPPLLKQADVYHSPYYLMPYLPGVPTVLTAYDLIPQLFPNTVSLRARLLFHFATRLALRAARHIICISEATRQDYLTHFKNLDPNQLTAIPLAPSSNFKPAKPQNIENLRSKMNLPQKFALYIGINKPHKNLVRLIEAWTQLENPIPLVIGGAWDPRYPEVKQKTTELNLEARGLVQFIGPVPEEDLPALYSASGLFIFPSMYEGFGLPVIEALACGARVACSNTSSLPEVGGDAVTYFNPYDIQSINAAVHSALQSPADPQKSLAQAKKFTWQKTAEATLAIYRSLTYN